MQQKFRPGLSISFLLLSLAGCAATGNGVSEINSQQQSIDAIELYTLPTVVNWDNVPGPDGVQVRILLFGAKEPQPVQLTQGSIEFVLFEGRLNIEEIAGNQGESPKPFLVWKYAAKQMQTALEKSMIGFGYTLALGWGQQIPKGGFITIVTRYQKPSGQWVYSAPVTLPMPDVK